MSLMIPRPDDRPMGTALAAEFFQIAYVTTDIEKACEVFGQRYGTHHFTPIDTQLPQGGALKIRVAWHGNMMIELIEANGEGAQLYRSFLPADGFAIRHHHFGFLVADDAQWDALHATCKTQRIPIEVAGTFGDSLRFFYVKAPELGHYLEYVQLYEGGRAFFGSIAKN